MKPIVDLKLGFSDAENYHRRENRELFNAIFVKNNYLESLLEPNTYFLIGEKGTGKTAYSVFLSNNDYKETLSVLKYIRETDYQKFVSLKKDKHLQLSDYANIWQVIILLLFTKNLTKNDLDHRPSDKGKIMEALLQAINEYYKNAFKPEIIYALNFVENSKKAAELMSKYAKIGGEHSVSQGFRESGFQVNLLYIQKQFEDAIRSIKLHKNHILFIDGIDIRPGSIPYNDYLDCIKGLANAVWSINNDFFSSVRDTKGRFKVVLLLRPDIFNSIGLQNQTNKIRDNSVLLDWRTTYLDYRTSEIFKLADKVLGVQQDETLPLGAAWDYYMPWTTKSTSHLRESDPSFVNFLRLSYSRPRDLITMIQILQENFKEQRKNINDVLGECDFASYIFQNKYSEYLMGGIKDQLSFYYSPKDYDMFLTFFNFLNGADQFDYKEYLMAYDKFTEYILKNHDKPAFVEKPDIFLQFLYDTNILCYIDTTEEMEPSFRWCYRERNPSNISPKVKLNVRYRIHNGLCKALNVGKKIKINS